MLLPMEELRNRLVDARLTIVAEKTGIQYHRLWRLMQAKQIADENDLTALTAYVERDGQ
jgi:hypothetical protein